MRLWTNDEVEFLKEHYLTKTHAEIGKILGRNIGSIRNKCWRLGLVRDRSWSDEEIQRLRDVYEDAGETGPVNLKWLEVAFGRHRSNICAKARQLGLNTTNKRASGEWFRNEASEWVSRSHKSRGLPQPNWTHVRGGKRDDLSLYVRSAWEANYARYLNFLVKVGEIEAWEYESETFDFEAIKRGTRSYTPDFKVVNCDGSVEYHEIKGWMDARSKTQLKRMAKYYPEIKVVLIGRDEYTAIARECKNLVPNWE